MMNKGESSAQQTNASSPLELPVQRLLRHRARERAAPLRWSIDSVILGYVCLAAVIIMSLREVHLAITVLTACLGIGLVWLSGWLRRRKLENKFYQEELHDYAELSVAPGSPQVPTVQVRSSAAEVDCPLTPRELAVLEQMARGVSNREIASALEISPQTVKNHISHILLKLDVSDRTAAVLTALHRGWIKLDK